MWVVELNKDLKKGLKKLPPSARNALTVWINIARIEGPVGLKSTGGFNDEALKALKGQWKGYRSSRLGKQYRVIYQAYKDAVRIVVVDVTAHDYRRK